MKMIYPSPRAIVYRVVTRTPATFCTRFSIVSQAGRQYDLPLVVISMADRPTCWSNNLFHYNSPHIFSNSKSAVFSKQKFVVHNRFELMKSSMYDFPIRAKKTIINKNKLSASVTTNMSAYFGIF
jgi:hypothetical protein